MIGKDILIVKIINIRIIKINEFLNRFFMIVISSELARLFIVPAIRNKIIDNTEWCKDWESDKIWPVCINMAISK